jgi:hypothetical protein
MKVARVATIGISLPDTLTIDLLGTANFAELDTVIWRPSVVQLQTVDQQRRTFIRVSQLEKWLREGHNLLMLVEPLPNAVLNTGGGTITVSRLPLLSSFLFQEHSGSMVQVCGPQVANEVFAPFCAQMKYSVVLEGPISPLIRVSSTLPGPDEIVAGHARLDTGFILLVPPHGLSNIDAAHDYVLAMLKLMDALKSSKISDKPEWVDDFRTSEEARSYEAIEQAKCVIASNNVAIAEQRINIDHYANLKELFFETGDTFNKAVLSAFVELGFKVIDGPRLRADLLALEGNTILAIEAKGLEGSAKEKDLREVETWKAETLHTVSSNTADRAANSTLTQYAAQLEKLGIVVGDGLDMPCKAIMVIGAFRKTPLPDRSDPDFPHAIVSKIELSRVCALSGLQLYNLVMRARSNPSSAAEVRKTLLETDGILEMGKGWESYLSKKE